MSSNIHIDIYPDYVFFKRSGTAGYNEIVESWSQVARTCKEHGIKKILAQTVNENYLSMTDLCKIASDFQNLGFTPGFKVAHVFIGTEPENEVGFGETVATNRGANYRIFNDLENARVWLLEAS